MRSSAPCARPRGARQGSTRSPRSGAGVDPIAEVWRDALGPDGIDADLYELSTCLEDVARALCECEAGERLFILLEEKAF